MTTTHTPHIARWTDKTLDLPQGHPSQMLMRPQGSRASGCSRVRV